MDITPQEYIRRKIEQAFVDLAEEMPDTGLSPMAIFQAQMNMLAAWEQYCEKIAESA